VQKLFYFILYTKNFLSFYNQHLTNADAKREKGTEAKE
jgi:hypothetical protein